MTTKVFVVSINCDNAAYEGEACAESVAANLIQIAQELLADSTQGHVHDYNGKIVGKYFLTET